MSGPKLNFSFNENLHQQVEVLIKTSGSVGYGARELESSLTPHFHYDRCREIVGDFVGLGYTSKIVHGDLRVFSSMSKYSASTRSKDTGKRRDVLSIKKGSTGAGKKSLSSKRRKDKSDLKKRARPSKRDDDYHGSDSDDDSSSEENSNNDDKSEESDDESLAASSTSEKPKSRAKVPPKKLKRTPKAGAWTTKQDALLLLTFLKHIFNSKGATPFRGSVHPQPLFYMVGTLFVDGVQPPGHAHVASRTRLLSLLEAFHSVRSMVSFVLLSVPSDIDSKLHNALNSFLEDSVEDPGGALARDTTTFTAGLRHAHAEPSVDPTDREVVKSTKALREFGWLPCTTEAKESLESSSCVECFTEGITATYKAMLSSSDPSSRGGVSDRILQSYASALDTQKKELSSAEGLLVAHGIFSSTRGLLSGLDETGANCFTGLAIRRTKGSQNGAVVEAIKSERGGEDGNHSKKFTVGKGSTSEKEKGHYDKPLNRIGFEMSFGRQGLSKGQGEEEPMPTAQSRGEEEPIPTAAAKTGTSTVQFEGAPFCAKDEDCPWLHADGTYIPSLFNDLAAKVVAVLASVPGASVERLHASVGLLSLTQMERLLADMTDKGMITRHIPKRGTGCQGLFSEDEAPSRGARGAIYFAY